MATGKYGIPDSARTKASFLTDEDGNPLASISISGTVNTVGGDAAATVNVAGGLIVAVVSGTVTAIGGAAAATVNVGGGLFSIDNIPTVNVGITVIVSGTVNSVGGSGLATVNIAGGFLTATVNLGSIGTINVGNTVALSSV